MCRRYGHLQSEMDAGQGVCPQLHAVAGGLKAKKWR
jgi:hypothetical protein